MLYSGVFDLPWWGVVIVALVLTHITIASVTIFLHRCQAHRALELHPIASHFFRFWLWLTTGMVTKEWAAIHRKHHAKCETPEDPHSPQQVGIHRVLWGGVFLYVRESRNKETLERYGHGTPDDWLERNVYSRFTKTGITIMLLLDVSMLGVLPGLAVWLTQMVWIPFWAAGVINGLGHYWGYRNWECEDASTNIFPIGILIGGEELHNNHHAFASSAKLSCKWFEFDIGWMYIRILEMLGLAKVKKVAPTPKFAPAKSTIDFDTLQAVLTHRYDVWAKYCQSLKRTFAQEMSKFADEHPNAWRIKRWLLRDESKLGEHERAKLQEVLAKSKALETAYAMRRELAALWQRSTASREQLLKQLQDWCQRAEESGIAPLREFALRLRSYAA
ncbi:MAG: fatty acid desaturase [Pseudomonadota bacterium]|nr:MAG: acyl-CoA desaturase [Pseudomonadota bacterium]